MGSLFISQAPPRFAPPSEINRFFLTPQISYHPKTQNCDEILFFCRTANGAHFLAPLCSARRTLRLAAGAASAPSEEGAGAPKGFRGATEGERTRACCLHRGIDEHRVKKRPFAFAIVYIKCFRTYSVYLSFRHGVFILYTPCHLPPQREARALPRCARRWRGAKQLSVNAITGQGIQPLSLFAPNGRKNPAPLINKGSRELRLVAALRPLHSGGEGAPAPCTDSVQCKLCAR